MPFTLGLTGGIASGKSLVGESFRELGVAVIDADQVSRDVVIPGSPGLQALAAHFGDEILGDDGHMDRRRMRERVFAQPKARLELEGILHPLIRNRLLEMRDQALMADGHGYCILMIPLLVKFGWTDLVERLLVVDCTEEMQLNRLIARDDIDIELAQSMLKSQDSRAQRLEAANDVILNDKSPQQLHSAVLMLHENYQLLGQGKIKSLAPQKV